MTCEWILLGIALVWLASGYWLYRHADERECYAMSAGIFIACGVIGVVENVGALIGGKQ